MISPLSIQPLPDGFVAVSGSSAALLELAQALRESTATESTATESTAASRSAGEARIRIVKAHDPVRIRWSAPELEVRGGMQLLHLVGWLEALAARPGRDVVLAYHPKHYYLAEGSTPLKIACLPGNSDCQGGDVKDRAP